MRRRSTRWTQEIAACAAALLLATAGGLSAACDSQGPAEEAGEELDDTADEFGDEADEMGDEMEEEMP